MGSVETSEVKLVKLNGVCSLESMSRVGDFMNIYRCLMCFDKVLKKCDSIKKVAIWKQG